MPEGDTIHRVANVLRRALAGKVVTGFEVVAPRMSSDAARFEVVGSVVRSVESNGKHLLVTFARGDDNVFKCEALFLERVSPWAKVADLDDATLARLVAQARKLMRLNRDGGGRRTRFA